MTTIEKPNAESLAIFINFEEAIVAVAAIQRVQGEDSPMLERTTDEWYADHQGPDPTLMDQIFCVDDEPREYGTKDSLAILKAIWELAVDPKSEHQTKAVQMIFEASDEVADALSEANVPAETLAVVRETGELPALKQQASALPQMEIRGADVVLRGFEQYVATRYAVSTLFGDSCDLLEKQPVRFGEGYNLAAVEHRVDPFDKQQKGEFTGDYAAGILEALHAAAKRDETVYDKTAAYMLAHAAVVETVTRPAFANWEHALTKASQAQEQVLLTA